MDTILDTTSQRTPVHPDGCRPAASPGPHGGALTPEEVQRYSRHLLLDNVGLEGQIRLRSARVLLVGAGGLGSPAALYLAAAGVGTVGIVDSDTVDHSNLQRQLLHGTSDIGRPKVQSAWDRLREVNPNVRVLPIEARLGPDNALDIMRGFDLVVDGSDSFATRYLVSDAAVLLGLPLVYGSVSRFEGQVSVFGTREGPCYRCLFREPPPAGLIPNCATAGVLGVLPGLVGTIQATEVLKLILGIGEPLVGRLLLVDALGMQFRSIRVRPDPGCPACGTNPDSGGGSIRSLADRAPDYVEVACAAAAAPVAEITATELLSRISRGDDMELLDVREPAEWADGHLEGARLVPLGSLRDHLDELDPEREIVVYCKAGIRSLRAAQQLVAAGFPRVTSLAGGISALDAARRK